MGGLGSGCKWCTVREVRCHPATEVVGDSEHLPFLFNKDVCVEPRALRWDIACVREICMDFARILPGRKYPPLLRGFAPAFVPSMLKYGTESLLGDQELNLCDDCIGWDGGGEW